MSVEGGKRARLQSAHGAAARPDLLADGDRLEQRAPEPIVEPGVEQQAFPRAGHCRQDGVRRAFLAMAEIQFAAGATEVSPAHGHGAPFTSFATAKAAISAFDLRPLYTRVVSAHVMGGAPIGRDPARSVVGVDGRHHHLRNLYVCDGSIFPTSIGANPQLSIYAFAARIASGLAGSLV